MESIAAPSTFLQRLRLLRTQLATELFEEDGLNAVFVQARNVLSGTVVVAAGVSASHHPDLVPGMGSWAGVTPGYVVFAIGLVLLVLNLYDGLLRLSRRQYPLLVRAAAAVVYIAITYRLVQVIAFFRVA